MKINNKHKNIDYDDNIFICKSREKYIKYILQCKKIASQAFKPPQN